MSTHAGQIYDASDELGLGFVEIAYELDYVITPDRRVEVEGLRIERAMPADGSALNEPLTGCRLKAIEAFVGRRLDESWGSIEDEILGQDCDPCDFDPDQEARECEPADEDVFRDCGWGVDESYGCLGEEL